MTTQLKIDLRRQNVKHMIAMGIPTVRIAEQLGVHRHTIERDIAALKEDILKTIHEGSREDIFLQIEARRNFIEQCYWRIYLQVDNWGTKLSALKQIQVLMNDWISILEKMGIIDDMASKPWELTEEQERFRRNVLALDTRGWKEEGKMEREKHVQEKGR